MIEYGIAIGYGTVIEKDKMKQMFDKVEENHPDLFDDLCDRWSLQIDSWTDGDYFLGVVYTLGDDVFVYNLDKRLFDTQDIFAFLEFMNKTELFDLLPRQLKTCLIHYCH